MNDRKTDGGEQFPRIFPKMALSDERLIVHIMKQINKIYQQQEEQRNVQNN